MQGVIWNATQLLLYAVSLLVIGELLGVDAAGNLFLARLARTLVIIAIAISLYRILSFVSLTRTQLRRITGISVDEALLPFLRVGLQFVIVAFAVVIAVQEWGYDVSALVAGLGIGGLAISLAAQDTIANLFGFSMIIGDRPFIVGDYIKTPDVEGKVEFVGLRSTRVRNPEQALVTVPNKQLANSVITNWSRLSKRLINFTLRLPREIRRAQIEHLMEEIRALLMLRPRVEPDSVSVHFASVTDASNEVQVQCYALILEAQEFAREREIINLEILRLLSEDLHPQAATQAIVSAAAQDVPRTDKGMRVPLGAEDGM
jgi:MscS family membrane protein